LVSLIEASKISGTAAKQVLEAMFESGKDAASVVAELGLGQIEDSGEIAAAVKRAIEANPRAVEDYRAGKTSALNALVGQVMKETRGRANAAEVQALLQAEMGQSA
jgi:aspartyl-tRNA(Asn)/glutamyl-tRNA(Gln) amidotransferase subunit B